MKYIECMQILIEAHVPYDEWPKSLQIAGVSEELFGAENPDEYERMKKTNVFLIKVD